jgi:hypothetical protein
MTSTPSDADTTTLEVRPVIQPGFAAARHGYDRGQVDEYLARLAQWTAQAQARAQSDDRAIAGYQARIAELEEELGEVKASASPAAHVEAAASRAMHAIEIALAEADAIRGRANDEAATTTATAREQALETVRAAQRAVAELEAAANQDRKDAADAFATARHEAEEAARSISRQAEEQAAERTDAARAEAERTRSEAEAAAQTRLSETEQRCAATVSDDEQRHLAAQVELEALRHQRDAVLEHLGRLRGSIEAIVGGTGVAEATSAVLEDAPEATTN